MVLLSTTRRPLEVSETARAGSAVQGRSQPLDVLRGITIVLMILVNNGGGRPHGYPLLVHAEWNGFTFADAVFPCFLFIVGVSLVFSVSGRSQRGVARETLVWRTLQRAAILFVIGVVLDNFPGYKLADLHFFGVLERIAFCYFAAVVLYLYLKTRTLVIVAVAILLGYYVLLRWVPVPGFGMPGKNVAFLDPYRNFSAWLDGQIFPASQRYLQVFHDPDGLLSSVASLASTLIGVLTGVEMMKRRTGLPMQLLVAGASCLAAGLLWSHWFPLNKHLWTSSFVLLNAGIGLIALGLLQWWLDGRTAQGHAFTFFKVFGQNALAAYVFSVVFVTGLAAVRLPGSGVSVRHWLFHWLPAALPGRYFAFLVGAIAYVGICFLPVWLLYRKRIFLRA